MIVSQRDDLAAEAMRVTGSGARLAFDPIGGPIVAELAAALAPQGMLILYGNLGGKARETMFPYGPALAKGLAMRGYLVFELIHDAKRFAAARGFIEEGLRAGTLAPTIARTFDFGDMVEAHRYLESGEPYGKIDVTVPQDTEERNPQSSRIAGETHGREDRGRIFPLPSADRERARLTHCSDVTVHSRFQPSDDERFFSTTRGTSPR